MSASSIAASYVAIGRTVNRAIVVLSAAKDLHRLVVLSTAKDLHRLVVLSAAKDLHRLLVLTAPKDLHVRVLHASASTSTGRLGAASRLGARVRQSDPSI